jgi:flavorubredoxin
MSTRSESGTNVHEIADGIYRINTPVPVPGVPGGFNFNQYLIADDEPLLFHSGPGPLFAAVSEAVGRVIPLDRLRYVAYSHFESDECGALNSFLAAAPRAEPVCSRIAAMVCGGEFDRAPRALADGATLELGRHTIRWHDAPHVPHGWDCGLMSELSTRTFFCGDLFTQGGPGNVPLTESDILGPSEAFRKPMDYYAHAPHTVRTIESLARLEPATLACMHGSAWRGDGAALLHELAAVLASDAAKAS